MSAKGIAILIAGIIGGIFLIVGLVLTTVVQPNQPGPAMVVGLVMLVFNGVFIGFPLRLGYERATVTWGTSGKVLAGGITGLALTALVIGTIFLIMEDGPNENVALPVWQLMLFGFGMALTPAGLRMVWTEKAH